MTDLEQRVAVLEDQLERTDLEMGQLKTKLAAVLKRLEELADDVGDVLEARECESDSALWSHCSDADGTTLSDDDSSSEEIKAAPVRLSKVVRREYEPIGTGRSFPKEPLQPIASVSLAKKYLDVGNHSPIDSSVSDEQPAKKPAPAKKPLVAKKPKADTAAPKKRKVKD